MLIDKVIAKFLLEIYIQIEKNYYERKYDNGFTLMISSQRDRDKFKKKEKKDSLTNLTISSSCLCLNFPCSVIH